MGSTRIHLSVPHHWRWSRMVVAPSICACNCRGSGVVCGRKMGSRNMEKLWLMNAVSICQHTKNPLVAAYLRILWDVKGTSQCHPRKKILTIIPSEGLIKGLFLWGGLGLSGEPSRPMRIWLIVWWNTSWGKKDASWGAIGLSSIFASSTLDGSCGTETTCFLFFAKSKMLQDMFFVLFHSGLGTRVWAIKIVLLHFHVLIFRRSPWRRRPSIV